MATTHCTPVPQRSLSDAIVFAAETAWTPEFAGFVADLRRRYPEIFKKGPPDVLERDYLRIVDHHLTHLVPLLMPCLTGMNRVYDFGCGSGGSSIAVALVDPHIECVGTDIDANEVEVARTRADLYGVGDRCTFHHVRPNQRIPLEDGSFDLSMCSSVLEYVDVEDRPFCVREMARLVRADGLLFFSVPNRLYPFEVHTRRWFWNYFPGKTRARIIDATYWEVARSVPSPHHLHATPIHRLFTPWSSFCIRRDRAALDFGSSM